MKAKKYLWSMICVYMAYLTHGIQALIFSQNNIAFAAKWGFDMSDPASEAYAAGLAAVSIAIAWTGFGKMISVWIGGEISDVIGRKKLMIGGAILYVLCFAAMLTTTNATVAAVAGLMAGLATSGFWDASGYPAVQEAYPAAPGTALIMIKFFVALSSIFYPIIAVATGSLTINTILPLVLSCVVVVLAFIAPFAYDDEMDKSGSSEKMKKLTLPLIIVIASIIVYIALSVVTGTSSNLSKYFPIVMAAVLLILAAKTNTAGDTVSPEVQAAKDRQIVAPGALTTVLTYFYAFLVMAVMYGAQQYTKAFGLAYCGLTDMQAASLTTMYQVGSIVAVAFWAVMMSRLQWHPLKVLIIDSAITALALLIVLLVHQVAIIYIAILVLGFGCAGGALQTGLSIVQEFVPGPKGRNTGIYYTFMGLASYSMPVIVATLTVATGEANAVYTLMILMLVFAVVQFVVTLYFIARYNKVFGYSPLKKHNN